MAKLGEGRAERGYYLMHRGWMDSPVFKCEPFTQREAWLWLIENAVWSDIAVASQVTGHEIKLKRGQLSYSHDYLKVAWGWSDRRRVQRYLDKLKKWQMIGTEMVHSQTVITVCNYTIYQDMANLSGTKGGTKGGTKTAHNNKEELIQKEKQLNKYTVEFEEIFYPAYPRKMGKAKAKEKFCKIRKQGIGLETIMVGLESYVNHCDGKEAQYIKHPATWLNGECWEDEYEEKKKLKLEDVTAGTYDPLGARRLYAERKHEERFRKITGYGFSDIQ